jgi:YegS/Rv2252/BmrU family lipid kinase
MRYLFIANPVAGKGKTHKLLTKIENFLSEHHIDYKLILTTKPGDINNIVQNLDENFEKIIVIGGDGTLHELINAENINLKTLGVIPTGSGNDFALTLGLKKSLTEDLKTILERKTLSLDIGYAELTEFSGKKFSFLFANSLGIGFDAEVAASVKKIKFIRGLILYLIGVFITLIRYKYRNITIKTDSIELTEPLFMISIGNGKTAGGGFKLTPLANPIDGLLDICLVKKISKFKVLRILPLAIFGKHITNSSVLYFKTKNLEIESDKPIYIHADGEIKSDQVKSIKITLLKNYANFISNGVAYANEKT